MAVVVTGGCGGLGSELVPELRSAGAEVVPASRRSGFDLATGVGVAEVLTDADRARPGSGRLPARHRPGRA